MAKTITGSAIYELKVTNPNAISNYNGGLLVKAISDDLVKFVGKQIQGLVVKESGAQKLVEQVKKDLIAKKAQEPLLRAGISGKDIVFLVSDGKNPKYEQSCVLVAGYVPLREKLKKQSAAVVNLDAGNDIIDDAASDMARNNRTTAVDEGDEDFGGITGTASIILLAHGDEDKTATGQIYGKDFADRPPADIVKLLAENPDRKKRLAKSYAGTVYLDGCFTAQGSAMQNYTKQVWDGLKAKGFKKLSVKGNLGLAETTSDGNEIITTSEADARADKLKKKADDAWDKATAKHEAKLEEIWQQDFAATDDLDAFQKDRRVLRIKADADKTEDKLRTNLEKELAKIPGYEVPNLVGQFGLTRLN